jgi:uncharacterized radical SAM superfamily Fe-S cluster-containing enzyme
MLTAAVVRLDVSRSTDSADPWLPGGAPPPAVEGVAVSPHAGAVVPDAATARSLVADLPPDDARALRLTASVCPGCVADAAHDRMTVAAVTYEHEGEVRLTKECPDHGRTTAVCWTDAAMFRRARAWDERTRSDALGTDRTGPEATGETDGCCGVEPGPEPEPSADDACCSTVPGATPGIGNLVVTNRCDRSCHYCFFYAESGEPLYEPTRAEVARMARALADAGAQAIQLTGGEPTVREDIVDLTETVAPHADQVLINTHGGRFAHDPGLARGLSDAGARGIYTSLDGVDPETNPKSYWEFPDALAACRDAGLCAMVVPTVIGGWNDDQVGDVVRFAAANADVVCGVNLQPVSFVGRMTDAARERQRVTIPDVVRAVEAGTDGLVPAEAWFPLPALRTLTEALRPITGGGMYGVTSSFASWMVTFVLVDGDDLVPITEVVDVEGLLTDLRDLLGDDDPAEMGRLDRLRLGRRLLSHVDGLLAGDPASALGSAFTDFDGLADRFDRVLPVGVRHFQDPYTYDLDHVAESSVHYALPDGEVVPFSAYNGFPALYRDRAKAEFAVPVDEWRERDYATLDSLDHPRRRRRDDEVIAGGPDGDEGVFGLDVTTQRDLSAAERDRVETAYRASVDEMTPVWETL